MKRALMMTGLALAVVPLAACADDYGYGYSRPAYYSHYAPRSYGWYDGYYGSIYDGYWGHGGYYYYRTHDRDRWRRDDDRHFRRGEASPGARWQHWDRDRSHGGDRGRGWSHRRDRDHDGD